MKRNYIDSASFMVENYFSKDQKLASQAEITARQAIEQVHNQQSALIDQFEAIPKNIPIISPAFRWAQSATHIFLNVKFATRFDSPACLDIFDLTYDI